MRINKFIASHSQYSRRKADDLILEGKVFVNDKRITKLGLTVDPEKDTIKIDSKKIIPKKEKIYLALNKPKGYVTTRKDELNRKTVMDLLPKIPNLKPAGRLDKDTEGLLFISNDGEFINRLTHPKFECEKTYLVKIKGELKSEDKENLEKGIYLNKKKTAKAHIKILKKEKNLTTLTIKIHEGRNRQIRNMFAYFDYPVKYLQRIQIGKISLGQLKKGKVRKLTKKEIDDI